MSSDVAYLDADEATKPIEVSNRPLHDVTAQVLDALRAANRPRPRVFVRGGRLARIVTDEQGRPAIERLSENSLRGVIDRAASFARIGQKGPVIVAPPIDTVRDVAALGAWPHFPALEAIAEAPTLRADGTILDAPGYDRATRLLYAPAPGLVVPRIADRPSSAEVAAAVELLRVDCLGDFPFASPVDGANALALLLTPIIRPAVSCVPLALIDAPRAGTGKGLLAGVAARIATGRAPGVFPAPSDEKEWGKSITSMLDDGASFILIDEARNLRSAQLSAALTSDVHSARRLGHTEMIRVPQRATWVAAGNNIRLGGDLPRRCYRVRLDAKEARPWTRGGFRHADLDGWTAGHRGDLLAALLTLARAWHAAGCPPAAVPVIGGFDEWARIVGGILRFAGVKGFLGNLGELYDQSDEGANQWEGFLRAVADDDVGAAAFTAGTLADVIERRGTTTWAPSTPPTPPPPTLVRDALPEELATRLGTPGFRGALGRALRSQVDTCYGEDRIRLEGVGMDGHTKTARYKVVTDQPPEVRRAHENGAGRAQPCGCPSPVAYRDVDGDEQCQSCGRLVVSLEIAA